MDRQQHYFYLYEYAHHIDEWRQRHLPLSPVEHLSLWRVDRDNCLSVVGGNPDWIIDYLEAGLAETFSNRLYPGLQVWNSHLQGAEYQFHQRTKTQTTQNVVDNVQYINGNWYITTVMVNLSEYVSYQRCSHQLTLFNQARSQCLHYLNKMVTDYKGKALLPLACNREKPISLVQPGPTKRFLEGMNTFEEGIELTGLQLAILIYLLKGASCKLIAEKLYSSGARSGQSARTIENMIPAIKEKIGVSRDCCRYQLWQTCERLGINDFLQNPFLPTYCECDGTMLVDE